MSQYKKLFGKSEIEYITPFLKLWMAFNNWYKQDLQGVTKDSDAINHYKTQGKIKDEFLRLFDDTSELGIEFNIAIYELILNLKTYQLKYDNGNPVKFDDNLILENVDGRSGLNPIYISETKRRFQIPASEKERLFSNSLEVIYQVRCSLVHGSFDIENAYFLKLVESSYKIMHPIIDRILETQADGEFVCVSVGKNVDAVGVFELGKMKVLPGSKVTKDVAESYDKKEERLEILSGGANEEENHFEVIAPIEFNSPSAASSFCLGNSSNGWEDWKKRSGVTMNETLRSSVN